MTDNSLIHEPFCLALPGESEPRTETFRAERTDDQGRVTSRPVVHRCVECGSQIVTG